jgi:low temperature requirement protein LtrA
MRIAPRPPASRCAKDYPADRQHEPDAAQFRRPAPSRATDGRTRSKPVAPRRDSTRILTFVIAFGLAASQFAHALAEGHLRTALIGFGFASFAISWAWINFSWFSSAYDTDDWIFRVVTMVQMIGDLAIGLPRMFGSLARGNHLDNSVMVLGYVIMRIAMVFQWLRAARQDPARRRSCPPMLPPSQSPSLAGSRRSFLICRSACP